MFLASNAEGVMNLRDLKYLVTVANTHHFGHAAEQCFVSQPTLSGQIKKLEEELGVILFERTKRSVETTPIGDVIVAQAKQVLEQADLLKQQADSYQDPLVGPLRIGIIPTLSPYLMPLILKPLQEKHPQIKLILSEEFTDTLLTRLRKHEIDVALIATPVEDSNLESIPLFDEPFWLAHPQNHPLSGKKKIIISDLHDEDLLLLAEGHCLADQMMEVCHMKDRSLLGDMADFRAASLETLLQMVASGFGSTLLPALALNAYSHKNSTLSISQLQLPGAYRKISLIYRHTFPRQEVIEVFTKIVLQNLPNSVHVLNPLSK